ncbi:unnamed protein product, partial [Symbiodinium microadriaticum]
MSCAGCSFVCFQAVPSIPLLSIPTLHLQDNMTSSSAEWTKVDDFVESRVEGSRRSTANRPSVGNQGRPSNRTSQAERDLREIVKARKSYNLGSDGGVEEGNAGAPRPSSSTPRKSNLTTTDEGEPAADLSDESDADTEIWVSDDESWRKVAEVFANVP